MSAIVSVPYDADEETEIVLFNDAGEWMITSSGAVEAFNQAHLAQYLLEGTRLAPALPRESTRTRCRLPLSCRRGSITSRSM